MKKIGYILLYIFLAFLIWSIIRVFLDVPNPSKEEFVARKHELEDLANRIVDEKDIYNIKFKDKQIQINNKVASEKDGYYSSFDGSKYDKEKIDGFISRMEELELYSISGGTNLVVFFKKGRDNEFQGYGYERIATGKSGYLPKFVKEKLDDHWYIIAIFK